MVALAAPSSTAAPRKPARFARVETWLDRERDQLVLWLPVALGGGIAAWFALPGPESWSAFLSLMAALAFGALLLPAGTRLRRLILVGAIVAMLGCVLAWHRAHSVAAPVLARPLVATFVATVQRIEAQPARARTRLTLAPRDAPTLPPRVRIVVADADMPTGLAAGGRVKLRARLVAPPGASVPGGFDFARQAWFQAIGAVGKAMGPVQRLGPPAQAGGLREQLSAHVRGKLDGSAGGIAAAFATGDRGGIALEDEEAMRASGLTHLLSVSGLHVTAVVGAAMLLTLRILALSTTLALRAPLLLVSALIGAAAGVGYTALTGAEVPTVRSCIAALLVLFGIAIGREAVTLRLVAAGATLVLLMWPEALVGPSFQLSFAAIVAIVALHETTLMQRLSAHRDDRPGARALRLLAGLLVTGLAVECALAPIALYHFHKSGLYGAAANIVAIPLTTFVIMPLEALALGLDPVGLGEPFWWLTGKALALLLWLAHSVAGMPGALAVVPQVPDAAFAAIVGGGLWLTLWQSRIRLAGLLPIALGAGAALLSPPPDLIVTGDGLHLAIRGDDGTLAVLRPRAGDYVRSVLGERAGELGTLADVDDLPGASCSADACRVRLARGGRSWQILALRSRNFLPRGWLAAECAVADIIVSDRRLPDWCEPKWLKADRTFLARSGGMAITLAGYRVDAVSHGQGAHPWIRRAGPPGGVPDR